MARGFFPETFRLDSEPLQVIIAPLASLREFIVDQGTFFSEKLAVMTTDELTAFIQDIGMLFVEAIDKIDSICAERS